MMKNIKPVLVLFVICAVVSGALSGTYALTKDAIALTAQQKVTAQIAELMPETANSTLVEKDTLSYYELTDAAGNSIGRAYTVSVSGYGGELKVMVGLKDENTVVGIRILSSAETPGLGKKAEEPAFYAQYEGISTDSFAVVKNVKNADNEIVAISSATITTKAVTKAVNMALADYTGKEAAAQ